MSDNGSGYISAPFREAIAVLGAAHPNSPLHPSHQRQGRAIHPDDVPPLGLRMPLHLLGRTRRCSLPLAHLVQPPAAPRLPARPQRVPASGYKERSITRMIVFAIVSRASSSSGLAAFGTREGWRQHKWKAREPRAPTAWTQAPKTRSGTTCRSLRTPLCKCN